ncbi:hypothetical protein AX14_009797 [Amanita brunnescens Koide BX004]|nr:hypothetical protein AX14_009797 [Amanita brunnescens Koide BX004]
MLKTELKTLAWASALLDNVYAFIKKKKPNAQFNIPQFRFVRAALGEERKKDQGPKRQAFLIGEYIDETSKGEFTKYINNGIAKPLGTTVRVSDTYRRRTEFLCFTQHVQYVISGKTAYISDYQGGWSLLTDPQVMTLSKYGKIFGDGNVPSFCRESGCAGCGAQ